MDILTLPSGTCELTVSFTPYEPPPEPQPSTGTKSGKTFMWTIHPKRRQHAVADRKRKALPFRRLSVNTDFRAWRRILTYAGEVLRRLRCEMTYGEIEDTRLTYAQMEATGITYGDLAECEVVIT